MYVNVFFPVSYVDLSFFICVSREIDVLIEIQKIHSSFLYKEMTSYKISFMFKNKQLKV